MQKIKMKKKQKRVLLRKGRPSLQEMIDQKGLSPEMKQFAIFVARGIPHKEAAAYTGISEYQMKSFLDLAEVQKEIAIYSEILGLTDVNKWIALDNRLREEAFLELLKRVREGKISEKELIRLVREKVIASNLYLPDTEESATLIKTKKITSSATPATKVLPKEPITNEQQLRIPYSQATQPHETDPLSKEAEPRIIFDYEDMEPVEECEKSIEESESLTVKKKKKNPN